MFGCIMAPVVTDTGKLIHVIELDTRWRRVSGLLAKSLKDSSSTSLTLDSMWNLDMVRGPEMVALENLSNPSCSWYCWLDG